MNFKQNLNSLKASLGTSAVGIIPDTTGRVTQVQECQEKTATGVDVVNCTLGSIWDKAEGIFLTIIAILAVILMIWAGIQYIQAQGNADKTKAARQRIINIVIAIILLVAAYAIINLLIAGASWVGRIAG